MTLSVTVPGQGAQNKNRANIVVVYDSSNSMFEPDYYYEDPNGSYGTLYGYSSNYGEQYNGVFDVIYGSGNSAIIYDRFQARVFVTYRGGTRYSRSENNRHTHAKAAVKNLGRDLLDLDTVFGAGTVELAYVEYGTTIRQKTGKTSTYSEYEGWIDDSGILLGEPYGYTVDNDYYGATNWEAALMAADSISFGDNDPVYIVFLSDGDPTVRISDPDADGRQHRIDPATGSQFTTEFGPVWGNGSETNSGVNFTPADNYALNTIIPHKVLFTVGFGSATEKMGQLANNGYYRGQPDEFGHSNDLSAAFNDIVGSITTRVGYSDVEITDGITGMTSTTLVNGNPQDFTYKVTVPGENNTVRDITDEVLTPEQKNASYTVSGDDPKESGRVTWNLGDTLLADGATYSVSFIVRPDQDAYDLVSDLNNGLRSWSSLNDTELSQIAGSGPNGDQAPYSLRTNTQAGVTYYPTIEVVNSNGEKHIQKERKGKYHCFRLTPWN